jgi:putative DNA primase/helicase
VSAGVAKRGDNMGDLSQWVCWRAELREGKATKVPYSPESGSRARSDDPATWGTLTEAKRAAREGDYDGIGFVFTESDPFCGVDLDACVDPKTGEIASWASEIVRELDSYTEFSPTGTGVHVLLRAKLPSGGNRRARIEMYDRGRFFTVTGRRLHGTSHVVEERQEQLSALHERLISPRERDVPGRQGKVAPDNGLDDDEVLRKAASAANGTRFAALWAGDRSGYTSDSEADLALCSMLAFWVGPDEARISSLFSRSGLMREKWDREDYRQRTISRAILRAEFYTPKDEALQPTRNGHHQDAQTSVVAAHSTPPEAKAFPVDAMPVPCRPLIEEATASFGCAPELVALPMLATLSSAIGTSRVVEIKGGWREWPALFLAVVAPPGAMKTPAAKVAKKPAFERQRELGKAYLQEKEDSQRETREWEVERRDAQKAGEPAPEEPEAPSMGRCWASDTTVEAVVGILEDNPRGLFVYRDELAGWVRSMDQYKGGKGSDRQHWLNLWSTDEVVVDRKSRMGEPIILAKPFVSLFGGIQPAMLGELRAGMEDGLIDRFLFAYPAPRHVRFTEKEIGAEAEERYRALYRSLSDLRLVLDEYGDPNPKPLKLTPEALRLFAFCVDSLGAEVLQPGFPRRLEGVWAKLRGYLARLSLILAVCRSVQSTASEERVEREDVAAAAKLIVYFKVHARRVFAEIGSPDSLEALGTDLKALIEDQGGKLEATATELYHALLEAGCEVLPAAPRELSKAVKAIAIRSPALRVASGYRGKQRILRLELLKNIVGIVGIVGADSTFTVDTDDTDDKSEHKTRPDAIDAKDTDAGLQATDDGRERFSL